MKIAIADDEDIYITLLKEKLLLIGYDNIIFEAVNGSELIKKLKTQRPHLIFIDIAMPEINGINAAQFISKAYPDIILIVYSHYKIPDQITKLKTIGVKGYLLKESDEAEIKQAINSAIAGVFYLDKKLRNESNGCGEREMQLMNFMFEDFDIYEIADKFNVSSSVVYKMKRRFFLKHQIKTDTGLIKWGIINGVIKL